MNAIAQIDRRRARDHQARHEDGRLVAGLCRPRGLLHRRAGSAFSEEFDGHDFGATHVIAYVGDEPVGTVRVRWFSPSPCPSGWR